MIKTGETAIMFRQKAFRLDFSQFVYALFFLVMAFTVILLVFGQTEYARKRSFLLENSVLLCVGGLAGFAGIAAIGRWKKFRGILEKESDRAVSVLTKLLFAVQVYVCYSAYFQTGWDVAEITGGASALASGQPLGNAAYFSRYPNNVFLLYLFSLIRKVEMNFGILDTAEGYMGILCVQCLLSSLTGLLLFKTVRCLSGNFGAWCAWAAYIVLVGSSGWLMIPYSDSMGLFFPVAILYLYRLTQNECYIKQKWMVIGAISIVGYRIKPQILLVLIAVVITECFRRKKGLMQRGGLQKSGIPAALAGVIISIILTSVLVRDITVQIDREMAFGPTHFIMMGLNSVNDGGYLESDVDFSGSFAGVPERTRANLEVSGQRLKEMGAAGFGSHLVKKLLSAYGDGTFAWRMEGNFICYSGELKNRFLSPALRNVIWGSGMANSANELLKQGGWLCILAASLGMVGWRRSGDSTLLAAVLSIIGLTVFQLMFEVRARYLYIYVPFYILTGVLGAQKIMRLLTLPFWRWGKSVPSAHPENGNPEMPPGE